MSIPAETPNEQIVRSIHLFSGEAFEVAKALVASGDLAALKQKANELRAQLPNFAAQAKTADQAYRPDLNRVLSEARLDLDYVLAGGNRPSSIRLAQVIREQSSAADEDEA